MEKLRPKGEKQLFHGITGTVEKWGPVSQVRTPTPESCHFGDVSIWDLLSPAHLSLSLLPFLLPFQLCTAGPGSEPPLHSFPLILTSVLSLTIPHPLSLHSSGQGAILGWFN